VPNTYLFSNNEPTNVAIFEHHNNVDARTFLSRTVSLADSVIDVVIDSESECIFFFLCCRSARKDTVHVRRRRG